MARLTIDHFSDALGLSMTCSVILPQETKGRIGLSGPPSAGDTGGSGRYPTLWLLHGRSDDHTTWLRRTSIERYVSPLGIAVVTPAVHLSRYANMVSGGKYWDYVSQELPDLLESWLPLAGDRRNRYVAGLSMGGWGAIKLGINGADRFAAAASLSGALRFKPSDWLPSGTSSARSPEALRSYRATFGDPDAERFPNREDSVLDVAREHLAAGRTLPRIYACCGTEDFLLEDNRRAVHELRDLGIEVTYEEGPGSHEWGFWDAWIRRVLQWMGFEIEPPELGLVEK
jgi:S-formylglutathione hydrolase FrmB